MVLLPQPPTAALAVPTVPSTTLSVDSWYRSVQGSALGLMLSLSFMFAISPFTSPQSRMCYPLLHSQVWMRAHVLCTMWLQPVPCTGSNCGPSLQQKDTSQVSVKRTETWAL